MKNFNFNKMTTLFFVVLLITSMSVLLTSVAVQAQEDTSPHGESPQNGAGTPGPLPSGVTPSEIIDVTAYLSFRPNPVGLNQIFLVNFWVTPPLNVERYHKDYIVTITKPSGESTQVKIDSYQADATAWFEWIADEVGDWTLQFDFQGTYFPAGTYLDGQIVPDGTPGGLALESAYYEPASTGPQILTVQEDIVYSWPPSPIPTD